MPPCPLPANDPEEEEEEEEEDGTDNEQSSQTHLVAQVVVQLQYSVAVNKGKGTTSKSKTIKKKLEKKTKDFPFAFEATQVNYLRFLTTLLEKHRQKKYTPVTAQTRFNIKAIVPPNKAYVVHPAEFLYLIFFQSKGCNRCRQFLRVRKDGKEGY